MTVISSGTASAAQAAARASATTTQGVDLNAQHAGASAAPAGEWDWATEGLTLPVSLVSTSDVITKLDAALATIIKASTSQEVRLLSVDNTQETNWRYSVAILVVRRPTANWASYLPLLIEATENRPLEGRAVRLGQSDRQVTVQPVPSDGLDDAYVTRIEQLLAQSYPETAFLYVQGMVIPRSVSFDDVDHLKRILATATRSCVTQLAEVDPNFIDNNLALVSKASNTVSRLAVTSGSPLGDKRNVVGQPTRQDVEMKLVAIHPQENRNNDGSQMQQAHSLNGQGTPEEPIGSVSAYVDFRFLPPTVAHYGVQDPKSMTRRFVPELVITDVVLNKLATTASLMMMISQMTALAEPRIMHSVLFQRRANTIGEYKNAVLDPTDLGVLNYMANIGNAQKPELYDLKSSDVGPMAFIDYVDRVLHQALAISIDVPRLGPQAAFMSVLTQCASGKPEALDFLQASLNKLTGNKFNMAMFPEQQGNGKLTADMVFSERNNTLYNGHFLQKFGGQTRDVDLRHVDMVALMARFGLQDPTMVQKWAQSFMINNIDPAIRMANKREVLAAYTQDGAVITGMSDRHTFATRFLAAIVACNVSNHFQPVLEYTDPLAGADTGLQAPMFMANGGLMTGAIPGTFSQAGGQNNAFGGAYANPTASRW